MNVNFCLLVQADCQSRFKQVTNMQQTTKEEEKENVFVKQKEYIIYMESCMFYSAEVV